MHSLIEKTEYRYSHQRVVCDLNEILQKYPLKNGQLSLTHRQHDSTADEKLYSAVGSLYDFNEGKFRSTETEFGIFNSEFIGTVFYEMFCDLGQVGRFRIMEMKGPKCYTVHTDMNPRFHYVISTDPECFFVFPDNNEIVKIPCDETIYRVDTTKKHTFVNGSRNTRIHLVIDDLS